MVARDFDRARATAKEADAAVRAAMRCRRCTACRSASRIWRKPPACAPPSAARSSATTSPTSRRTAGRRGPPRPAPSCWARPTCPNSAPAPTRATPSTAPPAIRSIRQNPAPVRPGGSAVALATGMVPICHRLRHRRHPAQSRGVLRHRRLPPDARAWCRTSGAAWAGAACPVLGPMARTVADTALLLSAMVSDDARDPLATTVHGQHDPPRRGFRQPAPIDLSRLRVALTPDFGFAPTERHIAEVFAEKTGLFRHVFARADDATPDCAGADEAFEVLRALGFLAASWRRCARGRRRSGRTSAPMSRRGCATPPRTSARAHDAADRAVPALAGVLQKLRRDPDAVDHHQPAAVARTLSRRRSTASRRAPTSTGWRWLTR